MELKLDSINRRKVKYCPCGKSNADGKFVPFKNAEKFGYCHSCAKLIKPDNKPAIDWTPIKMERKPEPAAEFISWEYYKPLMYDYHLNDNNRFVDFLCRVLGVQKTHYVLQDYLLGTGDNFTVIFPYINHNRNIVNLKTMDYDRMTGKRGSLIFYDKRKPRHKMCFFGGHLVDSDKHKDKPIAIVESEKTACLMSVFNPNYLWLACGGSNGLSSHKFDYIKYREIHLFPDEGKYKLWTEKLERLQQLHPTNIFKISKECEYWFESGHIEKGDDIADFYLRL